MKLEELFNQKNILDLSFFNFSNAITACYFANPNLEIQRINKTFKKFFPVLGNVSNAYLPDVLQQIGVSGDLIEQFVKRINEEGSVMIPEIKIKTDGKERVFSLLSTLTDNESFSYLKGVQGQFVDRTAEWKLRSERESLMEEKVRDTEIIETKSRQLENLANRLAKYLSPQIYQSLFDQDKETRQTNARKNLTVFFSDIVQFTDLTEKLEPEKLSLVINTYLSEMSTIALELGGTIDKFIGDAVLIFFGDPESQGETDDALSCIEMAIRMQKRVKELQKHMKKLGVASGIQVRMGISTGHCTVGNFGSDQRMDYTVLGGPVNLAARLQNLADPESILIDEKTQVLVEDKVKCTYADEITPKGFARPIKIFQIEDFIDKNHHKLRRRLTHVGQRVEVNVFDSSDIKAAIEELRDIQNRFEKENNLPVQKSKRLLHTHKDRLNQKKKEELKQ